MMNTVLLTRKHEAVVCELFSELARTRAATESNDRGEVAWLHYAGLDVHVPKRLVREALDEHLRKVAECLSDYGIVLERKGGEDATDAKPAPVEAGSMFVDPRDKRGYRTVRMPDGKVWMAENLDYETPEGSWCYNNLYGRLYTWEAAKEAVPPGWHLPTREEWAALVEACGGMEEAGKKLKSKSGWYGGGNGTDEYGFAALPGGYRYADGSFYYAGNYGFWWTATESGSEHAYGRYMFYYYDLVYEDAYLKSDGFSVRCVGDEVPA